MGHCRIFVVVVLTLLTTARLGEAQTVKLSVYRGGVETTLGWFYNTDDVRIDLADIHANHTGFEFIRIADMASPQGDVARVSVYRSGTNAVPEAVKILIGAAEDDGLFPDRFNEDLLHGCRHWGLPLTPGGSDDAFVVENSVLAEGTKVILAAAISGDLTGKVSAGQVFTLRVDDGMIADDVRATWGYLNPRYFGTVAVTKFDASAKRMTLAELKNMRHWDNFAIDNTSAAGVYTWRPR